MYADVTILYLEDPRTSLASTLSTIDQLVAHSSLPINWDKSRVLSLDRLLLTINQVSLTLARFAAIHYLGVQVSLSIQHYIPLNVEPLVTLLKQKKTTLGENSFMGKNQLDYDDFVTQIIIYNIFWHSPVYLP